MPIKRYPPNTKLLHRLTVILILPVILLAATFLLLRQVVSAAGPGDLDTTFGQSSSGIRLTDANVDDIAFAVYNLDDDSLIVGGSAGDATTDFLILKYTSAGALDTTFSTAGTAGWETTSIISGNSDQVNDLTVDDSDNIIAVGGSNNGVTDTIAIARYTSSGVLDTTFATNGIFTSTVGASSAVANAVALDGDGNIVVVGTAVVAGDDDFFALRLDSTGSLDTSFNSTGYTVFDVSGSTRADEAHDVFIQSTGGIVIGGFTDLGDDQDFSIARLSDTGVADNTFNPTSPTTNVNYANSGTGVNDLAYAIGEQSNGDIIMAGYTDGGDTNTVLARFNADGSTDFNFDFDGVAVNSTATDDYVHDLIIQQTDRIVVIGYTVNPNPDNEDFRVRRYTRDGALDTGFGTGGTVFTDIENVLNFGQNTHEDIAYAVTIQSDSKIVVVGSTDTPGGDKNVAVVRYESQNAIPTVDDSSKSGVEEVTLNFAAVDFTANFSDTNGDDLQTVQIVTLPAATAGVLKLNGTDVSANDEIPVANLSTLTFVPAANWNGEASFTWNGSDGLDYAAAAATLTLNFAQVNDPPTFSLNTGTVTVDEDSGAASITGKASAMNVGASFETTQTLAFSVTTNNDSLFAIMPAINATSGDLTFTPADNANGTAVVTVILEDNGGTANDGDNSSASQQFSIDVTAINDAPSLSVGSNQVESEDSGAITVPGWATNINKGADNESAQTLSVVDFTNSNSGLFAAGPTLDLSNGNLSFTPTANAFGSANISFKIADNGGTVGSGAADTSPTYNYSITINSVNDVPSFTLDTAPLNHIEDDATPTVAGKATFVSVGPANEASQTYEYLVTNNNNTLFSGQPEIDNSGTLSYTLAENANGTAVVSVRIKDSGGTDNSGVDTSAAQTFNINVSAVNDAPTFEISGDLFVDEESAQQEQNITDFATNISTGAANETQNLTPHVTIAADPDNLLTGTPVLNLSTGTLTFNTTAVTQNDRSARIEVYITDDGGTAGGGSNTSVTEIFTITMTFVNDAPTFTKGADQVVDEDSGPSTVTGWATGMDAGSPSESGQILQFTASADNTSLFSTQPTINATTGDLTYTPAPNANGVVTVNVTLQDDGGTANGGSDTSAAQSFTITINPQPDTPILASGTITGSENSDYIFSLIDFSDFFSDADDDSLSKIRIDSLPMSGTLKLNGTPVLLSQEIPAANVQNLTFTPNADWFGESTFTWNASDGTQYSPHAATLTIVIEEVKFITYLPMVINK